MLHLRLNKARRKTIRIVQGSLLGLGLFTVIALRQAGLIGPSDTGVLAFSDAHSARHLLATPENETDWPCTPPAIEQFPRGPFTMEQRKEGGLTIHIMISLYMFLGLAIACDDYFVPSLERISDALNLQSDVAGATFMAAGSSAPELATAVIGVFIAKDDIGLGAVVGSAVFNIMFVISVCALFAGMVVYLHWYPLARDCFFYLISIIALVLVILDEKVEWYEASSLLTLYVIYIIMMFFNPQLEKFFVEKFSCCGLPQKDELNQLMGKGEKQLLTGDADNNTDDSVTVLYERNGHANQAYTQLTKKKSHESDDDDDDDEIDYEIELVKELKPEEPDSPFNPPVGCMKRFLWLIALPMTICMYFTVPDCRRERWTRCYIITFTMSLVWISVYSYVMVWMITVIGYTLHIPDTVMGLTFVAAGVSVPDAIASLIVVQDGFGDMAVSNAVGSNVFDILLCLGLPWTLKTMMTGGEPVPVFSSGLTYASLTLLSTVVFLMVSVSLNGWKLNKRYGVVLMIVYVIVTTISVLFEMNVFGHFHPPTCPSNF